MIEILILSVVLAIGIFVQAAAGFAAGMLIVPTLLWLGYSIPEAGTALLIATIPQNVMGVYALRDSIEARQLIWPGVGRIAFFPVGALALIAFENNFPIDRIRQLVGAVVILATISIIVFKPVPRSKISNVWSWIAFPVSGFLQGFVGMGGPAMVFWVNAHDWNARQVRGFLFGMYLISIVPAIASLVYFFGDRTFEPAFHASLALPLLLLATSIGLKFGNWLGRDRLRTVTLLLLLAMGLVGLASPWISP